MKTELAERLLAKVMNWGPEDVAEERPKLQALASFKYDDYQQFSPGMRFVESLALWLNQLDPGEDRKRAYEFVCSLLIFISDYEMEHFVSIAYPDYIRPYLIDQVGKKLSIDDIYPKKILKSKQYKVCLRQSLFLGLSDGAHTDIFRRSNGSITHEQVWQTYEISDKKAEDMLSKLEKDLKYILGPGLGPEEIKFKNVFLLDDFSASGISYFRKDPNKPEYSGKIFKILNQIMESSDNGRDLSKLVDPKDINIYILLYVATNQSISRLQKEIEAWLDEKKIKNRCTVRAIQVIPDNVQVSLKNEYEIVRLLEKYFDNSIKDVHYEMGVCEKPYLGFNQCALPLILYHNTPNNSLPLLWFGDTKKYRGLFPRVNRHRSENERV